MEVEREFKEKVGGYECVIGKREAVLGQLDWEREDSEDRERATQSKTEFATFIWEQSIEHRRTPATKKRNPKSRQETTQANEEEDKASALGNTTQRKSKGKY